MRQIPKSVDDLIYAQHVVCGSNRLLHPQALMDKSVEGLTMEMGTYGGSVAIPSGGDEEPVVALNYDCREKVWEIVCGRERPLVLFAFALASRSFPFRRRYSR